MTREELKACDVFSRRWSALRGATAKTLRRRYPAADLRHFATLLSSAEGLADPALRIEFRLLRAECQKAAGDTPDCTLETVSLR